MKEESAEMQKVKSTKMVNEEFLGRAPIGKLLLKLALPTVIAQLINMLYNIVDRIYIGHMPTDGQIALTGLGVCMPLILLVSAFAALIANGGAPRASIYMGRGDKEAADRTLGNCFITQIIISVVLTAILLIFNEQFLWWFGASKETIGYATDYMNIYAVGTIFVQITLGMNAFITAQGFATTGMLSVLIGAVANIVLDPLFIYAFGMGVQGAALATILSQAASCAWVLIFLFGKKTILKIRPKFFKLEAGYILPSLALGFSTFVMQASESIILICFNSSLQKYGGDIAVGAMTVLSSVMQFAMLPLQGLGQGAQPIISYNYGAKNSIRVKKAFKMLLISSLCYSVLLWILVMAVPQVFVMMFNTNEGLVSYTVPVLRIYLGALLLFGVQVACQMTFTSMGNAAASVIVAVVRKFVLLLPLIYIMPLVYVSDKATAVFLAEPVADTIAVLFTSILFFFQFRRFLRKMNAPSAIADGKMNADAAAGAEDRAKALVADNFSEDIPAGMSDAEDIHGRNK